MVTGVLILRYEGYDFVIICIYSFAMEARFCASFTDHGHMYGRLESVWTRVRTHWQILFIPLLVSVKTSVGMGCLVGVPCSISDYYSRQGDDHPGRCLDSQTRHYITSVFDVFGPECYFFWRSLTCSTLNVGIG